MNCEEAKQIDLIEFMSKLGYTGEQKGAHYWYKSPFRSEYTASFSVDPALNKWIDFGTGQTGDLIDLVKLIHNVDTSTALQLISNLQNKVIPAPSLVTNFSVKWKHQAIIQEILPLQSKSCISYLKSRKLNIDIACLYVNEIYYMVNGKPFYSVGFRNDKGGYAIRNKYFKGQIAPGGITALKGLNPGLLNIVEGFISFLSLLSFYKTSDLRYDTIVLNSLVNLPDILPKLQNYKTINSYLDNDTAGRRARDQISAIHPQVIDKSKEIYPGFKDMNELLKGCKSK